MKTLIIDSGTTSSRVRLYEDKKLLGSAIRQAGAKDVAVSGSIDPVVHALRDCMSELLEQHQLSLDDMDAILASGMISSNVGLLEIPHKSAPIGMKELAGALVPFHFPALGSKAIHFIPGVKTGFHSDNDISDKDMMRGEEAEIVGYLSQLEPIKLQGEILFMHYGSHHKCIQLKQGRIEGCRTSITGELMMTIMQNTLLKSSLQSIEEVQPDLEWVRKGLDTAESSGFGRALFSVRVMETMEKCGKSNATSFYLGVLLSLDFSLLNESLSDRTSSLVLYGKSLFPSLFKPLVQERYPDLEVVVISEEESDQLSAIGAMNIYQEYLNRLAEVK